MERKWEADVLPLCKELGIGFVAFAPMGNGFLSGKVHAGQAYAKTDIRTVISRFADDNIRANQPLIDLIHTYAGEKGCTAAQISLAWVLRGGEYVVPIPGMRRESRVIENLGAADVELTDEEYGAINAALDDITIYCTRSSREIRRIGTVPDNTGEHSLG